MRVVIDGLTETTKAVGSGGHKVVKVQHNYGEPAKGYEAEALADGVYVEVRKAGEGGYISNAWTVLSVDEARELAEVLTDVASEVEGGVMVHALQAVGVEVEICGTADMEAAE